MSTPNILELLDRPIAFHRIFARVGGSVNAGVFLSQAVYWSKRIPDERNGWFYKTQTEWEDETFLSRKEQETARKSLRESGVLLEDKREIPAKLFYKVDFNALQTRMSETGNLCAQNGQPTNISENTSETTIAGPVGSADSKDDLSIQDPGYDGNIRGPIAPHKINLQPLKESDGSKPPRSGPPPLTKAERDTLLHALVRIDGADPSQVTSWSNYAKIVSQIRLVYPALSEADIKTAADNFKKKYANATVTANAIGKRWGELSPIRRPVQRTEFILAEPIGWQEFLNEKHATNEYAVGGVSYGRKWSGVDPLTRKSITEKMSEAGCLAYPSNEGAA